jgi:hypothetical protein
MLAAARRWDSTEDSRGRAGRSYWRAVSGPSRRKLIIKKHDALTRKRSGRGGDRVTSEGERNWVRFLRRAPLAILFLDKG